MIRWMTIQSSGVISSVGALNDYKPSRPSGQRQQLHDKMKEH